jgi:hypothetical protein
VFARSPQIPSYRHHKPSGLAVATFNGHVYYFGRFRRCGNDLAQGSRAIA